MRIRSIKPEFWRSPDISCLSIEDRLLFIGLWSYVDDNGVGQDRVAMVTADLFADDLSRDPSGTFARVTRGLASLSARGRIVRYSVDDRDYFEITNWSQHQRIDRPGKARMPSASADNAVIREDSRHTRDTLASGSGIRDQGTEDQGSGNSSSFELDSEFEDAWVHWPKKTVKKKALEQFTKAVKNIGVDETVAHVKRFGDAYAATTEKQYVPALDVWLRNERWSDELPQPSLKAVSGGMSKASLNAAEFRRLYESDGGVQAIDSGLGS